MRTSLYLICNMVVVSCLLITAGCGDDGTEADQQLIGGECTTVEDCDDDDSSTPALECILDFKGGYCGREGCTESSDCPDGSLCSNYETGNYCFLVCIVKAECNRNRLLENESNCSSSVDPVEGGEDKLCIPPTG